MNFKINTLNFEDIRLYSRQLSTKIQHLGITVDHILYVEKAGLFLGFLIAKHIDCPISGIYSRRRYDSIKKRSKIFIRQLPRFLTNLLRQIELHSSLHRIKKNRCVHISSIYPPHNQNILIVDDAIDTGVTLQSVHNFLIFNGYDPNHLKTAVLTTTSKYSFFKADISLFEQRAFAYPWSYDSNEYSKAQHIYEKYKSAITDKPSN